MVLKEKSGSSRVDSLKTFLPKTPPPPIVFLPSLNLNLNSLLVNNILLRSSLTFFYKIHSGTVSLDKDKYLTPAPNLRHTRASHESQYTRPFAYSDALKNSFFPRTIPVWNSLPSSVVLSKTIEEFKASI